MTLPLRHMQYRWPHDTVWCDVIQASNMYTTNTIPIPLHTLLSLFFKYTKYIDFIYYVSILYVAVIYKNTSNIKVFLYCKFLNKDSF